MPYKDPEKQAAYVRQYHQRRRAEIAARKARWFKANQEERQERRRSLRRAAHEQDLAALLTLIDPNEADNDDPAGPEKDTGS